MSNFSNWRAKNTKITSASDGTKRFSEWRTKKAEADKLGVSTKEYDDLLKKKATVREKYSGYLNKYNSYFKTSRDTLSRESNNGARWKWDASSEALQADRATNSLKSEAQELLNALEADRKYMTDEGYTAYKEFLTGVSKGDYKDLTDALKGEAVLREQAGSAENYKKLLTEAERRKEYEGYTYSQLKDKADILKSTGNKEKADWVSSFAKTVMTGEDYDAEIKAIDNEIAELESALDQYKDAKITMRTGDYTQQWFREWDAKYGSKKEIRARISQLEKERKDLEGGKTYTQMLSEANADKDYDSFVEKGKIKGAPYQDLNAPTASKISGLRSGTNDRYVSVRDNNGAIDDIEHIAAENMTEEEYNLYLYFLGKYGENKANELLDAMSSSLYLRDEQKYNQKLTAFAKENPFIASALSVPASLFSGVEYIKDLPQYVTEDTAPKNQTSSLVSTIRGAVSEDVHINIGKWDAGSFVYNTVMSGADSLAAGLTGYAGGVILGLSAAASATNEAVERGLSKEDAFFSGVTAGVFEGLFESVSIGNLKSFKTLPEKTLKGYAKNIAKSMLVNASEETLTEIANITYDIIYNGDLSNYEIAVRMYIDKGLSEEEARSKAATDLVVQVAEAGASGALMGFGFGAAGSVSNAASHTIESTREKTDAGRELLSGYGSASEYAEKAMTGLGLERNGNEKLFRDAERLAKVEKNRKGEYRGRDARLANRVFEGAATALYNNGNVGRLYDSITDKRQKKALNNDKEGFRKALRKAIKDKGTENAKEAERSIFKAVYVGSITEADSKIIEKAGGREILSELLNSEAFKAEDSQTTTVALDAYMGKLFPAEISEEEALQQKKDTTDKLIDLAMGQAHFDTDYSEDGGRIDEEKAELGEIVRFEETKNEEGATVSTPVIKVDDREVSASEIDLKADSIYSNVEGMDISLANEMISAYKAYGGNVSAESFASDWKMAYQMGLANRGAEHSDFKSYGFKISPEAAEAARALGQDEFSGTTQRRKTDIKKEQKKKPRREGTLATGEVHNKKLISEAIERISRVLNIAGYNVRLFEDYGKHADRGSYSWETNTINLNVAVGSGRGAVDLLLGRTLSHELTHSIQRWNPDGYEELKGFIIDKMGDSFEGIVYRRMKQLKLDRADAIDEVVAYSCEMMLRDSKALTEFAKEHRTLFEKICDIVDEFIKKIRAALPALYDNIGPESQEARFMDLYLTDLQTVFDKALSDALKASEATVDHSLQSNANKKAAEDGGKVQYSISRTKSMSWESQIKGLFLKNGAIKRNDTLTLLPNTPNELVELNTKDIPLAIPVKTISKGINGKDDNHSITKENMIKLFDGVTNAVAIINYNAKNSFMIVTDILQNGKPIVITFAKDSEFDGDNVHKATSVHIREDLRAHLEYLENAEIIIKNKNKLNSFTGNSDILARLHKTVKLIDVSISGSSEKSKGKVQKSAGVVSEADKSLKRAEFEIISDFHYGGDILDYKRKYKGYTEVLGFGEVGSEIEEIEIGYYKRGGKWRFADIATGQEMLGSELKLADLRKYVAENKEGIIAEITTDRSNRLYEKKTATPETIYDPDEKKLVHDKYIISTAEAIMKDLGIKKGKNFLCSAINEFFNNMIEADTLTDEIISNNIKDVVKVADSSLTRKFVREPRAQELLDYLKDKRIRFNDKQKAEAKGIAGSFGKYRTSLMGRINIVNDGIALDSIWAELCDLFPEFFSEEENELDMVSALYERIDEARTSEDPYSVIDPEILEKQITERLLSAFSNLSSVIAYENGYNERSAEKVYGESLIDSLERTVQTQEDQAIINDYRRVEGEVSIKRQELAKLNLEINDTVYTPMDQKEAARLEGLENDKKALNREIRKLSREIKKAKDNITVTEAIIKDKDATAGAKADAIGRITAERQGLARMERQLSSKKTNLKETEKSLKEARSSRTNKLKEIRTRANELRREISEADKILLELRSTKRFKTLLARERAQAVKDTRALMFRRQAESRTRQEDYHIRQRIWNEMQKLEKLLALPTVAKHVPSNMISTVATLSQAVPGRDVDYDAKIAKMTEIKRASTGDAQIEAEEKIAEYTRKKEYAERVSKALSDIFSSLPKDSPVFDEGVLADVQELSKDLQGKSLNELTNEELKKLLHVIEEVKGAIKNSDRVFGEKKSLSDIGAEGAGQVKKAQRDIKRGPKRQELYDKLSSIGYKMLKPYELFEMTGSEVFCERFRKLQAREGVYYRDIAEASAFYKQAAGESGITKRQLKEKFSYTTTEGKTVALSIDEMMSIYLMKSRPQAMLHLTDPSGGFRFAGGYTIEPKAAKEANEKLKNAKTAEEKQEILKTTKYTYSNTSDPIRLSEIDVNAISSMLTKDQKAFADSIQKFMAQTLGAKGNEVSTALYDVKKFTDPDYFPIHTDAAYRLLSIEKAAGEIQLKNLGFTKDLKYKAKGPLVLESMSEVFARHANEMSLYHAFAVELENMKRVLNYSTDEDPGGGMKAALGPKMTKEIVDFIKEVNGGVRYEREGISEKLISLSKSKSVGASLSVAIQQPSAIIRAFSMIDPKYFTGFPHMKKADIQRDGKLWEEMKRYTSTAGIKELGGVDINTSRGITDKLTDTGLKGKPIGESIYEGIQNAAFFLPEVMDKGAWMLLWTACKREAAQTYSGKKILEKAGERFDEIVNRTQVYDSVFSRPKWMRSKNTLSKMATAFMAEPLTTANMVIQAARDLTSGDPTRKKAGMRAFASVIASTLVNNLLVSFVYAARDDDEDESYLEKYIESFIQKSVSDIFILNYIPIFKDIVSLISGYDVDRMDMTLLSDLIDGATKVFELWSDENATSADHMEAWISFGGSILDFARIPASNLLRDVRSVGTFINTLQTKVTAQGIRESIKDGFFDNSNSAVKKLLKPSDADADKLYRALKAKDYERYNQIAERLQGEGKTRKQIQSLISKGIKQNDERVTAAAEASISGDLRKRDKILFEIMNDGFAKDIVNKAIESKVSELTPDDPPEDDEFGIPDPAANEEFYSIYNADHIFANLEAGDTYEAQIAIDDIFANKYAKALSELKDNENEDDAEKSAYQSLRSMISADYRPLYKAGDSAERERIKELLLEIHVNGEQLYKKSTIEGWGEED